MDARPRAKVNCRLASRSVWDGTTTASGRPADFTTLDFFRIEDGLIAEHWESVDWIGATSPSDFFLTTFRMHEINPIHQGESR